MKRKIPCTLVILLLVFLPNSGFADSFPDFYLRLTELFASSQDQNTGLTSMVSLKIPMGGEYESMATAYTAVAQDLSFLESNPAGTASLDRTRLALFHNNLIDTVSMDSAAFTRRWNRLGIGFATKIIHVPFESIDYMGRETGGGQYIETIGGINTSYNLLSGFYFHGISIGANIKYAARVVPAIIAENQSAITILGDFGILTRFNLLKFFSSRERNFAIGASLQNLGPNVMGEPVPTTIRAGLAYSPIRPILLAGDIIIPWNPFSDVPAENIGFATGIRAAITSFLRISSGFTLQGGSPRFVIGNQIDAGDFLISANYTLDYTTQFTHPDRFSLTASLDFGDHGRGALRRQVEQLYLDALIEFADGNLESSAALTNEALEIDPSFDPARELKKLAEESLDLQQEMSELESLD